jgi:hypothetical protein
VPASQVNDCGDEVALLPPGRAPAQVHIRKEAHEKLVAAAHAADPNDRQMKDALGIE